MTAVQDQKTTENKSEKEEPSARRGGGLLDLLGPGRISGVYLWIVLIVVYWIWLPHTFATKDTVIGIAGSQALPAIVTVGLLFCLAAGVFDLSIGYTISLVSVVEAQLMSHHHGIAYSIAVGLVVALGVGLVNAVVVVGLKINSFIGTLAVSSGLQGLAIWISGNATIVGLPNRFIKLGTVQPIGIPITVFYLAVAAIVAWYALEHTPFGRHLYAIGLGPEASRLAGIRGERYTIIALLITALSAGVAGTVLTAQVGSASPDVGSSYLLPVYAAAFLGATQIRPGRVNVIGALVATYLLATGSTGLQLGGAQSWVTYIFNAVALIVAVGAGGLQSRLRVRATARTLRRRVAAEAAP